jgi:hypothetical protein
MGTTFSAGTDYVNYDYKCDNANEGKKRRIIHTCTLYNGYYKLTPRKDTINNKIMSTHGGCNQYSGESLYVNNGDKTGWTYWNTFYSREKK